MGSPPTTTAKRWRHLQRHRRDHGLGHLLSAIAAVAFCGFVVAMVAYMFQPEKLVGWRWLVSVVLIYGVLFVPA